VAIDATGVVRVNEVVRGRLKLVNFAQPQALEKLGATLFRAGPDLSEEAPNNLVVHQGAVESSNSHAIQLLGETIQASRAYQAYQKVIQAFDDIAGRAVNDLAQTA
jgi:flagellar basal body rod protein FlgG